MNTPHSAQILSLFLLHFFWPDGTTSFLYWLTLRNFFQWRTGGACCSSLLFFLLDTTRESGWSLDEVDSTDETEEVGDTCKVSSESANTRSVVYMGQANGDDIKILKEETGHFMSMLWYELWQKYRVTHQIVRHVLLRQNKSWVLVYTPQTKTQLLLWCKHNLGNKLICHPVGGVRFHSVSHRKYCVCYENYAIEMGNPKLERGITFTPHRDVMLSSTMVPSTPPTLLLGVGYRVYVATQNVYLH